MHCEYPFIVTFREDRHVGRIECGTETCPSSWQTEGNLRETGAEGDGQVGAKRRGKPDSRSVVKIRAER